MTSELVLWFGSLERNDLKPIEQMLQMLPSMSADLFESCDVGVWIRPPTLRVGLRLRNGAGTPALVLRISTCAVRVRGIALSPATAAARTDRAVDSADLSELSVIPSKLPQALDRAFSALRKVGAARVPTLSSHRRQHVHYDARRRELSLPSNLTVLVGSRLDIAVRSALTSSPLIGSARVAAIRHSDDAPRSVGRFLLTLVPDDEALHAAFVLAGAGEATVAVQSTLGLGRIARRVLLLAPVECAASSTPALRDAGFEVVVASGHAGAIRAEALAQTDVVVLAADAPAEAEAVLRAIRTADPRPLPIVVSSAAAPSSDPGLLRAGADVVLAATSGADELVRATLAAIEGSLPRAVPIGVSRDASSVSPSFAASESA